MRPLAYVFRAELVEYPGVVRTVALTGDQTLEDLHEVLRVEFGWEDPHLYSFWLSGTFWDDAETEYTAPEALEETEARSAATPIAELGLEPEQQIAYLFDFGDSWEVEITVADVRPRDDAPYPQVLEREGEAPPQYEPLDDEDEIE